ncbi:MAG: hypothetical protein ACREIU_05080 [Planctomycetota bacterium]
MRTLRWMSLAVFALPGAVEGSGTAGQAGKSAVAPLSATVGSFEPDRNRVYLSQRADGTHWARGRTYKARFGADGIDYIPYLGSSAPRNYLLRLAFQSASIGGIDLVVADRKAPSIEGTRVTYDRGGLKEVYDLAASSVEQLFVLSSPPLEGGDLVVRVNVSGDLAFAAASNQGLRFEAPNGLGGVAFGRATLIDDAGVHSELLTRWEGGAIEIALPSALLAEAAFPVRIDPVLQTISVDATAIERFAPDVSFDATTRIWACVFEENFSAAEHDVFWAAVDDATGIVTPVDYVDMTADDFRHPRVANNNRLDGFLVVAEVLPEGEADRSVWGLEIDAATQAFIQDDPFDISEDARMVFDEDETLPDVGGDAFLVPPTSYLVVFEYLAGAGNRDIAACLVEHETVFGVDPDVEDDEIVSNDAADDFTPAVSNSNGVSGLWGITWVRDVMAGNIMLRTMDYDGDLSAMTDTVDAVAATDRFPDIACNDELPTPGVEYLVVWQRENGGPWDIWGATYSSTFAANGALSGPTNFHDGFHEPGVVAAWDQRQPTVDANGSCEYTYSYAESAGGGADIGTFCATVVENLDDWGEGHVPLGDSAATDEFRPRIASRWSSSYAAADSARYMAVWEDFVDPDPPVFDSNIEGAFYEPGSVAILANACGAPEPTISYAGSPSIGAVFSVDVAQAQGGIPFVILRLAPPAFFFFCAACPILAGGLQFDPFSVLIPCDPALVGLNVSFQGVEVICPFGCAGGCPFPFEHMVTDTLDVTIR